MATLRQIAQLGHPILRAKAVDVPDPIAPEIQSLVDDLLITVADVNGVGIAAPQVYEPPRVFIVASKPNPRYPNAPEMEPTAMINPSIEWSSTQIETGWEGCLSIPGIRGLVPRSTSIRVSFPSRDGVRQLCEYSGFIARVFQHEYDHLEGIVFLDRLESTKDIITEKEYLKIVNS